MSGNEGIAPDRPSHECGVFGVYAPGGDIPGLLYEGLRGVQHRGQDAVGVVLAGFGEFYMHKDHGLVPQVLGATAMAGLRGFPATVGVGHTRYSTMAGEPQPFAGDGFALAHNGHLLNTDELMTAHGVPFSANRGDSYQATQVLSRRVGELGDMRKAMSDVLPQLVGGFSMVLSDGERLIGARDRMGFHPLGIACLPGGSGYALASETVSFDRLARFFDGERPTYVRDVRPGEHVFIGPQGIESQQVEIPQTRECAFEFIYFMARGSLVDGEPVSAIRERMGEELAAEHPILEADLVLGVPNSAIDIANGYARVLNLPTDPWALRRNEATGRTFIAPTQEQRDLAADEKFEFDPERVADKHLIVIDDSIVRGTTYRRIVRKARDAGARRVDLLVGSPPYVRSCHYGMDTGRPEELLAYVHGGNVRAMAAALGGNSLGYLSQQGVVRAITNRGRKPRGLCTACVGGEYPTEVPTPSVRRAA